MQKPKILPSLENDLEQWQKKEELYKKTMGERVVNTREFRKAKYKHLKAIYERYKSSPQAGEAALKALKAYIKSTRRELYPRIIIALVDTFRFAVRMAMILSTIVRGALNNSLSDSRQAKGMHVLQPDAGVFTKQISSSKQNQKVERKRQFQKQKMLTSTPLLGRKLS